MEGKMVIVSAPSGAGKTTIVRHLLNSDLGLEFSVSACSRPPRPNEKDGVDYYFMSSDVFREKIAAGEFLEWQEVYQNQYYGTLRKEAERIWAKKHYIIFDVDVKGGLNLKKLFPEYSIALFIMPPSFEVLEERLRNRSTEDDESLRKRLGKARSEMEFADEFDHIVVNDELEKAEQEAYNLVDHFLNEAKV
jgi:guanylate kinase